MNICARQTTHQDDQLNRKGDERQIEIEKYLHDDRCELNLIPLALISANTFQFREEKKIVHCTCTHTRIR